jgi:hypothetical protein
MIPRSSVIKLSRVSDPVLADLVDGRPGGGKAFLRRQGSAGRDVRFTLGKDPEEGHRLFPALVLREVEHHDLGLSVLCDDDCLSAPGHIAHEIGSLVLQDGDGFDIRSHGSATLGHSWP